jgi:integrase
MSTLSLLFYRLSRGKTMPRFTGDTIRFTNATVKTVVVPEGKKDKLWFDTEQPGFFIRKFKSGKATYGVKYVCRDQQRRITLGPVLPNNLDSMRKLAGDIAAKARNMGIDELAERQKARKAAKVKKLGDLLPTYLEIREKGSPDKLWKKLRPNSLSDVVRYLKRAWQPFHALSPDAVTRQMVIDRMAELTAESGPIASKRAHAALSTFFAWLIHNNHCSVANPTMGIKLAKEEPRSRTLAENELVYVWLAAGDDDFGVIVKLLMLTGQRLREIGNLEWLEIELEKRQIELPEPRTKNGKPHLVPLSAPALALLRGILRHEARRLVFPGCRGSGMTTYSRHKDKLDKRIAELRGGVPLPPWRLHDLRRSVVTQLSESRERRVKRGHLEEIETYCFAQPHVVEAIVNHISGAAKAGVAGNYNKAIYLPERKAALEQWAAHLIGLIERHMTTLQDTTAKNLVAAAPSRSA